MFNPTINLFNPTINQFKKFILALLVLLFSATLFSCGGGSSSSSTTTPTTPAAKSLTGTAATGVPIDGNVLVTDSSTPPKTVMAVIDASGNYTADVTGFTPPLIISAIPCQLLTLTRRPSILLSHQRRSIQTPTLRLISLR